MKRLKGFNLYNSKGATFHLGETENKKEIVFTMSFKGETVKTRLNKEEANTLRKALNTRYSAYGDRLELEDIPVVDDKDTEHLNEVTEELAAVGAGSDNGDN